MNIAIESLLDHPVYTNVAFGEAAKSVIKNFVKHDNGYYVSLDEPLIRLKLDQEQHFLFYTFEIYAKPWFFAFLRRRKWEPVILSNGFVEGYSFAKFLLKK